MVVVYRVPAVVPDDVRAAFEERGIRLREGDEIAIRPGKKPLAVRELDPEIMPFAARLPVAWVEAPVPSDRGSLLRRHREADRPGWLKVEPGGAQSA